MIAKGETFSNAKIALDGAYFENCKFERCILVYSGLLPVTLQNNNFIDCRWEFSGPAANTVGFMQALHKGGAKELIERTLDAIRGGGKIPVTAGNA
jgi:hypothetical protein